MEHMTSNQLVKKIQYHKHKYWVENDPEISDPEYDNLVRQLYELDPYHPELFLVHAPLSSKFRANVVHESPMLSLDKVNNRIDLIKWINKVSRNDQEQFVIELKYDGLTARWTPYNVTKTRSYLSTRGDGYNGEDITDKVPLLLCFNGENFVPLNNIQHEVTGEIVTPIPVFKEFNGTERMCRKSGEAYKNPRSSTVGVLSRDDWTELNQSLLVLMPFDSVRARFSLSELRTFSDQGWIEFIEKFRQCDYPLDGLVFKLEDEEYSKSLGFTSHHPRGQMAYKFDNPNANTILRDIRWSLGKKNITPVGEIEPVEIAGHRNMNVTLHNYKFILDHDIQMGDSICIEKAGEIIPHYLYTVAKGKDREPIKLELCPVCHMKVKYIEPNYVCVYKYCFGKKRNKLIDACKRLGLETLGPATLDKVMDAGFSDIVSILDIKKDDALKLPNFKEKSAQNLCDEIQRLKGTPIEDWRVLSCLNIESIGTTLSRKLLSQYSLKELMKLSIDDLKGIHGIGPARAQLIYDGLVEYEDIIKGLITSLNIIKSNNKIVGTVCFTGKNDQPRSYWEQKANSIGFEPVKSVTKDLTLLVTNDPNSGSSKMKKAEKYGIKVTTYEKFERV